MIELVPQPGRGRVFADSLLPGGADAGPGGRVRLDAIARWLQDLAYRDVTDSGFEQEGAWILRRLRIAVEAFPRFGERVELRTFCSGLGRFSAERRTSIAGEGAARIESAGLWAFIDPEAGRPVRFEAGFAKLWGEAAQGRDAKVRLHHPQPPEDATESAWEFRATELDLLEHVNNSNYWLALEEELAAAGAEPASIDAEIEFHEPARAGPVRVLRSSEGMWIVSPEGSLHASILISG